jgi:two-component system chemotaxis response regulator CheB
MSDGGSVGATGVFALGASAGGVDALGRVLGGLPPDLPAALCVVLHIPPSSRGLLADVLARQTPLRVTTAVDGEGLQPGCVYVAPPDKHLLVEDGHVALERGPKENGSRPAIDPLFRSVAEAYGASAAAVVLSGSLSDGATGAAAVAAAGGAVLVQDPAEAMVSAMPKAALAAVPGAITSSASALAGEIARRAGRVGPAQVRAEPRGRERTADSMRERARAAADRAQRLRDILAAHDDDEAREKPERHAV